ncbi:NAD(P)/FAD-dependent oxidoreductase [Streptomyces sp. TP-A0874]|uniref:NAD(P)/FAD-dependent oxidoreductase n=1 Tax=Streptomyces sp. TP-A0874 TaxID=549819 RepID=UPI000852B9E3|nr:NAD(P)/FAD-dependent oxidoreductase [Streptomyces sp. TP-A0874]
MLSSARRTKDQRADVIVVGSGLAGLSAAHRIAEAGLSVAVLEASGRPGGRMVTDQVDGFLLDRSGRLLTTGSMELTRHAGLSSLVLRPFSAGVLVRSGGRSRRMPELRSTRGALTTVRALAHAARAPRSDALDQARLTAALNRLAGTPTGRTLARPERSAAEALSSRGLPARTVDGFLRPLLAALLGDPELTTSSHCADLALRGYARGRLCLPAGGASALPDLLAAALPPDTVCTGVRAVSAATTSVTTADHGVLGCRAVVVATDARSASELLPGLRVPDFHPATVLHHTAEAAPTEEPALFLDADRRGPVSHTAVVSATDPSRTPPGRPLITSTVLGPVSAEPIGVLDKAARRQLAELYGTCTEDWELIGAHHDPEAVPAMPAPHDFQRPVRLLSGLYVCGDHRDTSSVEGALISGRRAADALLGDFGLAAAPSAPAAAAA